MPSDPTRKPDRDSPRRRAAAPISAGSSANPSAPVAEPPARGPAASGEPQASGESGPAPDWAPELEAVLLQPLRTMPTARAASAPDAGPQAAMLMGAMTEAQRPWASAPSRPGEPATLPAAQVSFAPASPQLLPASAPLPASAAADEEEAALLHTLRVCRRVFDGEADTAMDLAVVAGGKALFESLARECRQFLKAKASTARPARGGRRPRTGGTPPAAPGE